MKQILLTVAVVALVIGCYGKESKAAGFEFSDSLRVRDSVAFALSKDTVQKTQPDGTVAEKDGRGLAIGIFSGSIAGYHTGADNYRIVGFGGVAVYASSSVASDANVQYSGVFTPLTLFGDTFQLGVGRNLTSQARMLTLGMTATNEEITGFFSKFTQ
jgi:hypothetical protein